MNGQERWLPVPETDGRYDVSDLGRVRSNGWEILMSNGYWRRTPARILSGKPCHQFGYVMVNLSMPGGQRWHTHVHTLVLSVFISPRPDGYYGCHNNGDPADNRLANLRWATPSSNNLDKRRHGTDHYVNKTHCGACGEPYNEHNTHYHGPSNRWRRCKNCMRRYQRSSYHRRKQTQ
jgi:hypothetical protein